MYCDETEGVCLNVNLNDDDFGKKNAYIYIVGIIIFFIHIIFCIVKYNKFSLNCFAILGITIIISITYMIIQYLRAKVVKIINNNSLKVGDYYVSDTSDRINNYVLLLGNLIFFGVLIYFIIKKQLSFNCDKPFIWKIFAIPFIASVLIILKLLIKSVKK
jgi:hypothetical protein